MSVSPQVTDRSRLGQLDFIAEGGFARLYATPQLTIPGLTGRLVYKEYKSHVQVMSHGLRSIVAVRARMEAEQRKALDRRAAWPVTVVEDGPRVTGVLMPLIDDDFFQVLNLPSGKKEKKGREVQYLFVGELAERFGVPRASSAQRLILCRQFSYVLGLLHRANVVYGDISATNILYGLEPLGLKLVDCDAVRVRGTASVFGKQAHTWGWEPPEATDKIRGLPNNRQPWLQSVETDRYKLGLFILRTLAPGKEAAYERDPGRADSTLDRAGRAMLRLALEGRPKVRPTAQDWYAFFKRRTGEPRDASQVGGWRRTADGWARISGG